MASDVIINVPGPKEKRTQLRLRRDWIQLMRTVCVCDEATLMAATKEAAWWVARGFERARGSFSEQVRQQAEHSLRYHRQ